jgi:nucleotide-binding universal stress UspA family protein
MKKILCPTDFSETADRAVVYAAKLAQKTGSHLDLFNVQSLADRTPDEAIMGEQMNAQMAYDRLEEFSKEISRVFKISCNGKVSTTMGGLAGIIEREAGTYDLLVMGTNGPENIFQFFFGSNSYRVAAHTQTPVLILPAQVDYAAIRTTAFAFDYWRSNSLPLKQVAQVLKPLQSDLIVLEVLEPSISQRAEAELLADQQIIRDTYGQDLSLRFDTLHTEDVPTSLDNYVRKNKVDMLTLCTQHQSFIDRLFHKSLIKQMSKLATYPLLIVHA